MNHLVPRLYSTSTVRAHVRLLSERVHPKAQPREQSDQWPVRNLTIPAEQIVSQSAQPKAPSVLTSC
ncbi:unnamed protein product, partial [Dicrocoelium dendriticum]